MQDLLQSLYESFSLHEQLFTGERIIGQRESEFTQMMQFVENSRDSCKGSALYIAGQPGEPSLLQFKPYNAKQIYKILKDRIDAVTDEEVFEEGALSYCSKQIGATGDIRRALEVCRILMDRKKLEYSQSGKEDMEEDEYIVSMDEVIDVIDELCANQTVQRIRQLPLHGQLLVISSQGANFNLNLTNDIGDRFAPFNTSEDDLIISELRTADGYLVSPHLTISDALVENDVLVAVDFESWKTEQYKLCGTAFESLSLADYENDNTLTLNVGTNTKNNLYVSVSQYKQLHRLEIFDLTDLNAYTAEGKHLITHYENSETKAYAKAYFVVSNGSVGQIELEVKTFSAPRPEIKLVDILIKGKKVTKSSVKVVQASYDNSPLQGVVFPTEEVSGPAFPDYDMDYTTTDGGNAGQPEDFMNITSSSGVRFEQVDVVRTEHGHPSNGLTSNMYYTDLQLTNTTEKKITLTKLTAEYQNKEGKWETVPAFFGVKQGVYNYSWRWEATPIPLDSRDTIKLSINTRLSLPVKLGDRLRRSSKAVPNPVNIRITVTDDTQVATVLPVVYRNKTEYPVVANLKYRQKSVGESDPIVHFQTVDNFNSETRAFSQIIKKLERGAEELKLSNSFTNTYYTITNDTLHKFAYQASKAKTDKFKIDTYCAKNEFFEVEVFAMVDLAKSRTTGLCIVLKSETSSNTSYFAFPTLIEKSA
eukprot:gene21130-25384_t